MFYTGGSLNAVVDKGLTLCLSNDVQIKFKCPIVGKEEPLRLHQFVCTAFRQELNVAENGAGLFIKNGVRASAHYAILQGAVSVNGALTMQGRTVLKPGDLVSLKLEQSVPDNQLLAWKGSATIAAKLEDDGKNISERKRDEGKRRGRMMPILNEDGHSTKKNKLDNTSDATPTDITPLSPFIQYYRDKFGATWKPEVHESAMAKHLPLTIRVLKQTERLDLKLVEFGFRRVDQGDFSLHLWNNQDGAIRKTLDNIATVELLSNTWIMANEELYQDDAAKKQHLGVFLSDARISGEILQQELNSMLPVSIIAAVLKSNPTLTRRPSNLRVLDMCAAPGSKTCQLLNILNSYLLKGSDEGKDTADFTVVVNELVPPRACRTQTRCFFQGNPTLSHLIVTAGDGCAYADLDDNCMDFVICDVPCSGDGTIRKSPEKLRKWTINNAVKNKPLQKELLRVGLKLLKPSRKSENALEGILVYSTCSLNALENDEVVLEVIEELNEIGPYRHEIIDLESISSRFDVNNGKSGNFLKVLPATSHGGFFVCALRKLCLDDNAAVALESSYKVCPIRERLVVTREKILSYAISPFTQRCCDDLSKVFRHSQLQLIGCGVPVLYHSNNADVILQEGSSCLSKYERNIPLLTVDKSMLEGITSSSCTISTVNFAATDGLQQGAACLVELFPLNTTLPAKVLQIDHSQNHIIVEFTAMPQIMKRINDCLKS